MGADFLFAVVPRCNKPEEALEKIKTLSTKDLEPAFEYLAIPDRDGQYAVQDVELVRRMLSAAVQVASEPGRDAGWFKTEDGSEYVISGGMSWGDDPTHACYLLWLLEASRLEYE